MNLSISQNLINSLGVQPIVDWRRELPVNKNYTWAQLTGGPRNLSDITTIALHHDGVAKSGTLERTDLQLATTIANNHIKSTNNEKKGDAGFPYHIWIRNGFVYYCVNLEDMTYGISSNNGYTVHICVSGDYYNYDSLTEKDRNALYAAIYTVQKSLPAFKEVKSHGEINPTDCPGYDMKRVRSDMVTVQNKMAYMDTPDYAKTRAYSIANQILFFYNLAQGKNPDGTQATPGNIEWGKNVLLELDPFMTERGLL
ncbi:N-acetylmuramoyl-L-alanine amidase [Paenibacillus sp. H1-7]|uniref:peptidoglycan recognition protein family protein n=1 Tax=Paenibacillus sp. H1-7 TaxID=2282849 RepID=UPI001EF7CADD|nr:N-acetylmuramoyl-L-alanine amidase [Paenibacillus sp. H1-7]